MYDLIIIGAGPAGAGAAVYAARKKIKTLLITDGWGGQSVVSADIQNWIGVKSISGFDFGKNLEGHARAYEPELEIWDTDLVEKVEKLNDGFRVVTKKGKSAETKTILVTAGSRRRRLGVPGEDRLDGKGVAWCPTCDAPLFNGKVVAVIGGGNAGLEAVLDLNPYASKIYLLHRGEALKGDPVTQEKILSLPKATVIYNAVTQEILGEQFVSGLKYKNTKTGEEKVLAAGGVFVEIGSLPNSGFVKDLVERNAVGEIVVDHKTQKSSAEGIWAAGDVSDVLYKQNNISVGDAVKAVLNIYSYLHEKNRI